MHGYLKALLLCRHRELTLPLLVSVLGEDAAGHVLRAHWAAAGLPSHGIHSLLGVATPCVAVLFEAGMHPPANTPPNCSLGHQQWQFSSNENKAG